MGCAADRRPASVAAVDVVEDYVDGDERVGDEVCVVVVVLGFLVVAGVNVAILGGRGRGGRVVRSCAEREIGQ